MKYELIGQEGGEGMILIVFRKPWGVYFRWRDHRWWTGKMFKR